MTRPSASRSESRFLTAQQVADLFAVTKSTVNRWREGGYVQGHPLPHGKGWRYPAHQTVIADALAALRRP
jgi:hypothetical protein